MLFFAGLKNTAALPHSHGAALNLMVYGEKKWIFFDSNTPTGTTIEQFYYKKYPKHEEWINWYNQEYDKLKLSIPIIECIQELNDIVYIPNKFNHTVLNIEETMGIVVETK